MNAFIDKLSQNTPYVLMGLAAVTLILVVLLLVLWVKHSSLNKKYQGFMAGADGHSLEEQIMNRFRQVDTLQIEQEKMAKQISEIDEALLSTFSKVGILKYDAFQEMGGKLSFTLCMLNDVNDGFIINSMHSSREGCYTYVKEIIKGESFVILSEEEKTALQRALDSKNYME